jgi:predicted DNA-binding transcriptional regulator AlpA
MIMAVERYLKLAEFAARAQLGESTVFQWIKEDRLREGIHYVRLGRALRFPFPQCLEAPLEEARARRQSRDAVTPPSPRHAFRTQRSGPRPRSTGVNLDWGLEKA